MLTSQESRDPKDLIAFNVSRQEHNQLRKYTFLVKEDGKHATAHLGVGDMAELIEALGFEWADRGASMHEKRSKGLTGRWRCICKRENLVRTILKYTKKLKENNRYVNRTSPLRVRANGDADRKELDAAKRKASRARRVAEVASRPENQLVPL